MLVPLISTATTVAITAVATTFPTVLVALAAYEFSSAPRAQIWN